MFSGVKKEIHSYDSYEVLENCYTSMGGAGCNAARMVAEELRISERCVYHIIHGAIAVPSYEAVKTFCRWFNIDIERWCCGSSIVRSLCLPHLTPFAISIIHRVTGCGPRAEVLEEMDGASGALDYFTAKVMHKPFALSEAEKQRRRELPRTAFQRCPRRFSPEWYRKREALEARLGKPLDEYSPGYLESITDEKVRKRIEARLARNKQKQALVEAAMADFQ